MATILAGRVQLQRHADELVDQLKQTGFAPEKITSFFLNPPGQHALYPLGGDRYQSPGFGKVAGSLFAKIVEALFGIQRSGKERARTASAASASGENAAPLRKGGMLVAIELTDPACMSQVVDILTRLGAEDIEKSEGEIVNGEWRDFNALSTPCYV